MKGHIGRRWPCPSLRTQRRSWPAARSCRTVPACAQGRAETAALELHPMRWALVKLPRNGTTRRRRRPRTRRTRMPTIHRKRSTWTAVLASWVALVLRGQPRASRPTPKPFSGAKANTGTVTYSKEAGHNDLTLSDASKVPDPPDPRWEVGDSTGKTSRLERLPVKGQKVSGKITLPASVPAVVKVQSWCAFAETLLGEAEFEHAVK